MQASMHVRMLQRGAMQTLLCSKDSRAAEAMMKVDARMLQRKEVHRCTYGGRGALCWEFMMAARGW